MHTQGIRCRKVEEIGYPNVAAILAVALAVCLSSSCSAGVASRRDTLAMWLSKNETLAIPITQAHVLADSMPAGIVNHEVFSRDETPTHLAGRCISLAPQASGAGSSTGTRFSLCIFSVPGIFYASVFDELSGGGTIIWDTTTTNDVLQPAFQVTQFGGNGDTSLTVIVSSLAAGLGGMRSFGLINWDGRIARLLGTFYGTQLDTLDMDKAGFVELKVTDIIDYQTRMTIDRYYKLDPMKRQYEVMEVHPDSLRK